MKQTVIRKLSRMEQALTLMDQAYPLTAVCVLNLENGPTPEKLQNVLQALQRMHPVLKVAIANQAGEPWFSEITPCPPVPLEILDRRDENHWRDVAKDALNRSVETRQGPMMLAFYLLSPRLEKTDLILAFHHAIGDAASLTEILHQLLQSCGEATSLPEAYTLLPAADDLFPKKWKGLSLIRRLPGFFFRQIMDEWNFRKGIKHLSLPKIPSGTHNDLDFLALDRESTQNLIRKSRREGVSIAGLLSAAMLLAVREFRYQNLPGAYRAIIFADLRPFLMPSVPAGKLGCYISMLRFTEHISETDDLRAVARRLSHQVYHAAKRGERFLSAFLSKMLVQTTLRQANQRLGATAISYAGPLSLQSQYGAIRVKGIHGYITNNPLGAAYTAFGKIFDGCLELDIQFLPDEMSPEEARQITDRVKDLLENYFT